MNTLGCHFSPAPLAVEYGAAELPNEEANAQGEPTPGPSGLSTVTAEPPLGHRAPTGNIIRLNAVETGIENDQRNESKDKAGEKEESTINQAKKRALSTETPPPSSSPVPDQLTPKTINAEKSTSDTKPVKSSPAPSTHNMTLRHRK